jgi:ribonuclease VapC
MSETENSNFVLDAWALLAHFDDEVGAERVREALKSAENHECTIGMCIINVGEVAYIIERERGLAQVHDVLAAIRSLPITVLPANEELVLTAAHIKANHRLSYAGAFAAATAQLWRGKLLTGDPELKALDGSEITVEWLPR